MCRQINLGSENKLEECFQDFIGKAKSAHVEGLTDEERENRVVIDFYNTEACGFNSKDDVTSETNDECIYVGALGLGRVNEKKSFRSSATVSPGGFALKPFTEEERQKYEQGGDGPE